MGQWFLSEQDLSDSSEALPGKLLIYLWDDLLRHHARKMLFAGDIETYGELSMRTEDGKQIFSDDFLDQFVETGSDEE